MATRITTDMLKSFDGEGDVVAWVMKVKLVAKLKKVDDVAEFLPLFLEGNALAMYLELSSSEQASADKIEAKLVEAFADGPFVAYRKLVQKKWVGEPVDVYANEIRRLAKLAGLTGDGLKRIVTLTFINGLPDSMSVELQQVDNILTVDMTDILTRARILTANKTESVAAVATTPHVSQYGSGKSEQPQRVFGGRCYRCGGPHMQRNCKIKRVIKCYRCGNKGHISPQCEQGNDNGVAVAPASTLPRE